MNVPGLVTALSVKGVRTLSSSGYRQNLGGLAPLEMKTETSFDIASLTKIIVTTNLIMIMVDEGSIKLTDQIREFFPAWNTLEKQDITIKHLLEHRSGLIPWRPLYISCSNQEKAHSQISKLPLINQINSRRIYSDLGFMILGFLIEKIYQADLSTIFKNIFVDKLGFIDTQYSSPVSMDNVAATSIGDKIEYEMVSSGFPYLVPEKVQDFQSWRSEPLAGQVNDGNAFQLFGGVSGHAGLFSTARDLMGICEIYLASFKSDNIFKQSTVLSFSKPGLDPMQGLGFRNWRISTEMGEQIVYGHTGFTGVGLGFIPGLDFAALMLTNRLHTMEEAVKTEDVWLPFLESSLRRLIHEI